MNNKKLIFLGLFFGFIIAIPIVYPLRFVLGKFFFICFKIFANSSFLKDIFGVTLGSFFAFTMAIWQMNRQNVIDEQKENEYLDCCLKRIIVELNDNQLIITKIQDVLNKKIEMKEKIIWASVVVSSFSDVAYLDLLRTAYQKKLPIEIINGVFDSYRYTNFLKSLIKECEPAINLITSLGVDEKYIDEHFTKITETIVKTNTIIDQTVGTIKSNNKKSP